jgi:hypothetical protein
MITKHVLNFSHNGEYVQICSYDLFTKQESHNLANDLYKEEFYNEAAYYDKLVKNNPVWDLVSSIGENTHGNKNPDGFFNRFFSGKKLYKTKDPFIRYEFSRKV